MTWALASECRIYQAIKPWTVASLARDLGMPRNTLWQLFRREHRRVPHPLFRVVAAHFKHVKRYRVRGWSVTVLDLSDEWEIEKEWRRLWTP